jgi:hypothetical protein
MTSRARRATARPVRRKTAARRRAHPTRGNKPTPARDGAVGKDDLVCKSDPVDIARGNVVLAQVDLELPSPLLLERLHISSYRAGR